MAHSSPKDKIEKYEKMYVLGEGRFGTVYKARNRETGLIVAVKKIKPPGKPEIQRALNRAAVREIKHLCCIKHPNIIRILDVYDCDSNISMVFELMETDLHVVINDKNIVLTQPHIKAYMMMILRGLEFLHTNFILHRDLKPRNLLISKEGVLKIADFGLARSFGSPNKAYTNTVVTLWYRAPELLYGARAYETGVDIWAVGCILAELLHRIPFFPGESEIDQLSRIFEIFGTPTEENWPTVSTLPHFLAFKPNPPVPLDAVFAAAGNDLLELIARMLTLDPLKRCTCKEALRAPYFGNSPFPTPCSALPRPASAISPNRGFNTTTKRGLGGSDLSTARKRLAFDS